MQVLLNFFIKHNHWFLFLLLEGISFMLIVRFNNYQSASFFTATNRVAGDVYSMITNVNAYFGLKKENEELLKHNLDLTKELTELQEQLATLTAREALDSNAVYERNRERYLFNTARVVNNSLNSFNNYIVLDKGTADGVHPEMGVFGNDGVVGVIYTASEHYSLVVPLLNSKSNISCRVRNNDNFCTLQWDGEDISYSYLIDLPRYTKFEQGDTVVTSGFSSIFPGDIPVGIIDRVEESKNGMFYRARVKILTDFASLNSVYVIGNRGYEEQQELENKKP
ncbi:MAG: rod shape-determining protein MreC [Bacteroidaceae bacterium]|nr:rod shape-determining protein MreC [Bacteroidaceae bacterium]